MVVLSVSLLGLNGKILVARQFVEMSRIRIEGLLAAFPKLLGTGDDSSTPRQHTFIDTESVRYVYQPLEKNHFLVLITNKTSNIVEDLQTLTLLSKLVPDVCGRISDESIKEKQFDLVFAFDETLTAGGHSENINLNQIRTNLEMESHEEKLHNMILQSKKAAAKDEMKRQQQRIREEQRERQRVERASGLSAVSMPSIGSGSGGGGSSSFSSAGGFLGGDAGTASRNGNNGGYNSTPPPSANPTTVKTSGMKLGLGKKGSNFMDAMAVEDDLREVPPMSASISELAPAPVAVAVSSDPIATGLEEKITVQINREGTLENFEVKGSLFVVCNDASTPPSRVRLRTSSRNGISFQTHPKVNKPLFEKDSILSLKDTSKCFPDSKVGVLRWSLKSTDESFLPISLTCWPEEEGDGKFNVNIEYTLERSDMILENVDIMIPLGTTDFPEVVSIDGEYHHNQNERALLWHHAKLDRSNSTGSLEFRIRSGSTDGFFPIRVTFHTKSTYADIEVVGVETIESGQHVQFGYSKLLTVDSYMVQ